MKDIVDWGKFGVETIEDAVKLGNKVHSKIGGNKIKDANNWKKFALETADDALGIFDKVKSRGGMVYSQSLKDALNGGTSCGGTSCGGRRKPKNIVGEAVKPRATKFVKGSQEAKDHMAKIRAMRSK